MISKEKIRNFAMEQGMKLAQNDKIMQLAMKAFELRGKLNTHVEQKVAKVAESLNLVNKTDFNKVNFSVRGLDKNVKNISTTIETIDAKINELNEKLAKLEKAKKAKADES